MLPPFLFASVVDAATELAGEGVLSELLHVDNLLLMSEIMEGLWNEFMKWKEVFESNGLKDDVRNTKVMVSGSITNDGLSKSKDNPR